MAMLPNRDEMFQQYLKAAGGTGQAARDAAAKRLSVAEGRPLSSAYRPGQGSPASALPATTDVTPQPRPEDAAAAPPVSAEAAAGLNLALPFMPGVGGAVSAAANKLDLRQLLAQLMMGYQRGQGDLTRR